MKFQVVIIEKSFITLEVDACCKSEATGKAKIKYRKGELSSKFEDTDAKFEAERIS